MFSYSAVCNVEYTTAVTTLAGTPDEFLVVDVTTTTTTQAVGGGFYLVKKTPASSGGGGGGGTTFTSFTLNIGHNYYPASWLVINGVAKAVTSSTTSVTWIDTDFSSAPISLNVAYSWQASTSSYGYVQTDHTFGPTVSGVTVGGAGSVQSLPWVWNGNPSHNPTLTFTSSVSSLSYYVDT
jgi:hypothetical protein